MLCDWRVVYKQSYSQKKTSKGVALVARAAAARTVADTQLAGTPRAAS